MDHITAKSLFRPVATALLSTSPDLTAPRTTTAADQALTLLASEVELLAAQEDDSSLKSSELNDRNDPDAASASARACGLSDQLFFRIAEMAVIQAQSMSGVTAKAKAGLAPRGSDELGFRNEEEALFKSLARDVVRVVGQPGMPFLPVTPALKSDRDVIILSAKVVALAREQHEAQLHLAGVEEQYEEAEPDYPRHVMAGHEVVEGRTSAEIRACIAASEEIAPVPPDSKIRMLLAAVEQRETECALLRERLGIAAAEKTANDLFEAVEEVARALTMAVPSGLPGLVAKSHASLALDEAGLKHNDWDRALADAVKRDTLTVGFLASAAELAPAEPCDRPTLESYNAWLDMERRLVAEELYGKNPDAMNGLYLNNEGGRFHAQDKFGAPSRRAHHVLDAVGIDWRNDRSRAETAAMLAQSTDAFQSAAA